MALDQRRIRLWVIRLLLLLSQASAQSAEYLYDISPLNYTKGLNITESGARNLSGIDWNSIIPPFRDFLNGTNHQLDRPDKDVFSFTPENVENSNLHEWYAAWTRDWSSHPMWESHGETGMWAYQFLNIDDYFCDVSATHCTNEPDRDKIQKNWPGPENRALAQRIYLHHYMLSQNHNIKRQELDAFTNSHSYFSDYAFDIVKTFTMQVDDEQVRACEIIHKVVDLAVQVGVSMAGGAASALSNALTAEQSLFSKLASVNVLNGQQFSNQGIKYVNGMLKQVIREDWSDAAKFDILQNVQSQFWSAAGNFAQQSTHSTATVHEGKNTTKDSKPMLDPGMGTDFMCSAFEGDRKDLNEANTHELNKIMGDFFSKVRNQIQTLFSKSYNGWIPEPGMPSMMAIEFATRDWAPLHGPNSTDNPLKDPARYETDIMSGVLKYILSRTAADDNIYLYCLHVHDAQKQCNNSVPKKKDPQWYKNYRSTQICPRPETDPTLLCAAARWYHTSTMQSHVGLMPGIDKVEEWNNGRFHLTMKKLLQEAYETYVVYRNDFDKIKWSSGRLTGPVFGLPTCVSDDLLLHDGNPKHGLAIWKNPSYLQFPFRCGDFRANESAGFMKSLNLGPGSKMHERLEGVTGTLHPNELFEDRIIRLLDERNTSAVSHYLNLCEDGIRLPEKKDTKGDSSVINQWRVHTELDRDCGLVKNGTANMSEFDANRWFCENRGNHTIFQRQQDHHVLPETQWEFDSHKKRCDKWLKALHKKEKQVKAKDKNKSRPWRRR